MNPSVISWKKNCFHTSMLTRKSTCNFCHPHSNYFCKRWIIHTRGAHPGRNWDISHDIRQYFSLIWDTWGEEQSLPWCYILWSWAQSIEQTIHSNAPQEYTSKTKGEKFKSIHPFSSVYLRSGRGGNRSRRETQPSLSLVTLSSSSRGIPKCSQARRDI